MPSSPSRWGTFSDPRPPRLRSSLPPRPGRPPLLSSLPPSPSAPGADLGRSVLGGRSVRGGRSPTSVVIKIKEMEMEMTHEGMGRNGMNALDRLRQKSPWQLPTLCEAASHSPDCDTFRFGLITTCSCGFGGSRARRLHGRTTASIFGGSRSFCRSISFGRSSIFCWRRHLGLDGLVVVRVETSKHRHG